MKKVAIIAAMEQEIALLRNQIENLRTFQYPGTKIYTGQIGNAQIALLKSGIGKVSAAISTTLLLQQCKPDVVINTGSAGGLDRTLKIGDIVVSEEVRYHDVDVTAFGYKPGQMANCPVAFFADSALIRLAENAIKELNLNVSRGLICSGDAFIGGAEKLAGIRATFPNVVAVEMEAAAVAHACYLFGTPFLGVRFISDLADSVSHINFSKFLAIVDGQAMIIVLAILKALTGQVRA